MNPSTHLLIQQLAASLEVNTAELDLNSGFVHNGGNSLSAVDFASRCKSLEVSLPIASILSSTNLRSLFTDLLSSKSNPIPIPDSSDDSDNLSNPSSSTGGSPRVATPISSNVSTAAEDDYLTQGSVMTQHVTETLSEMQASLLHGSLKSPGTNIIYHYETYRTDVIPILKKAWKTVIEGEPIFQASLLDRSAQNQEYFTWTEVTVETEAEHREQLQTLWLKSVSSSFKVVHWKRSPLAIDQSTVIWAVHHALVDGYSAMLLFCKVRRAIAGLPIVPGPSFSDVEKRIRNWRQEHKSEGDEYWAGHAAHLEQAQGELLLPAPAQEGTSSAITESEEVYAAPSVSTAQLHCVAKRLGVTLSTCYYAAWSLVLSLYADSASVVFGAVLAGRNLPLEGVDEVVGPLVNTLPLCLTLDRQQSAQDFLKGLFSRMVELAEYQWTTPDNGYTRNFSSAMAMQVPGPECKDGVSPLEPPYTRQTTDVPLSINILTDGAARFVYHTSHYSRADIVRLGQYFQRALQLLLRPHRPIEECLQGLLGCVDIQTLMGFGNCSSALTTTVAIKEDLVTLFECAASRNSMDIAVQKGSCHLTYQELDTHAGRVAATLRSHIQDGEVVCLHADRSVNWIVGIMGILKAGGVYCALDKALPQEARETIFSASGSCLFLVPSVSDQSFCPTNCDRLLVVEDLVKDENIPITHRDTPRPQTDAYLCFTSGSTGKPKGVMCLHQGLVAFQRDLEVRLFAQPGRRVAQIMSVAFDGSIHEIFSALSYGATLVLQSGDDPFAHLSDVDSAILTPSMARVLNPADFKRLSTVYLVGEPVTQDVCDRWSEQKALYNMYGPTEGTCGATIKQLHPRKRVTIGPPNPSTRIYIMNQKQGLVPPGVIGEIYIAGVQVARHYIGMPEQTAQRFVADPIIRIGERMYKTGDRGYWSEDGEVVCLGRTDRQIKLRGFRLDLDDLETRMIRAFPAVTAVALTRQGNHLIAAILPASTDVDAFAARVAQVLPPYATPRKILALDEFPTTKAGKRDYQAIAKLSAQAPVSTGRALTSSMEKLVGDAFRDILQLGKDVALHTHSSFRELGGHSLLQLLLATRISQGVNRQVPLYVVAQHDRIDHLAAAIDSGPGLQQLATPDPMGLGESTIAPIEREWWHKYQINESTSSFNVNFMAKINEGLVDRARLVHACNEVMARHRVLRSRYIFNRATGCVVRQYSPLPPRVQAVKTVNPWVEVNRPFSLSRSAPIRAVVSDSYFILTISHIVADLTTLQILLREISSHYQGGSLQSIPYTYMNSTLWQEKPTSCDLDFWSDCLGQLPATTHLLGHGGFRRGYRGRSALCEIPTTTYQSMRQFLRQSSVTAQQLSLAVIALCLDDPSTLMPTETDIVLGIPYINRKSQEDLDVVGLFLEPLPVRIKFGQEAHDNEKASYLDTVQRAVRSSVGHAIHWDQLLEHLQVPTTPPDHPLFDVVVTFHSQSHSNGLELSVPGLQTCYTYAEGAKFRLLCEFSALSEDRLLLRLEYDTDCFTEKDIHLLQSRIPLALSLLVQNVPYDMIRQTLARPPETGPAKVLRPDVVFGTPLSDIQ
ncbi:hypothetical protein BDV27DRAFT_170270 [Aspergillus caelatus]|uniref:Carrier domain-containing protein n=1 Tax=Aspergillus caelatus TaxID=61420 RepID=A0A5N7AAZ7_9EURO|nr:uncharacterized protein BDV27DRAFT_170270 [Aspergillus caelatus]KAE8367002.1 hypothetical protein BDV27DRAFT_170270 [Aspergillus caelatus]